MSIPTISQEEELHWLALVLVAGLGARKAALLLDRFRSPREIFQLPAQELEAAGLAPSVARSIASGCTFEDAVRQQERMKAAGVRAIPLTSGEYPPRLREIFDPPLVLFALGRVELLQGIMVGVVGTRRASPYGKAVTQKLAGDLSRAGVVVVSGMARGIDTAAHRAALDAGGGTVAVFGCGVDVIYPSENRQLAAEIAACGLIVSEFPMGAPAYPQNFPVRNRIIAGMSAGTVIVEGAQYSGSTITARLALEQGRELFAVPGNITSRLSWAPNLLIKQGAKLVQDWNDIVEELPEADRRTLARNGRQRLLEQAAEEAGEQKAMDFGPNAPLAKALLAAVRPDEPVHIDVLLEKLEGYSSSEIIATLFELEMLGLVRQLPGRNYVTVWQG
jgi:DNA processing protein